MKITEENIPIIEKALDIRLLLWQINFLIKNEPFPNIYPCHVKEFDTEKIKERCNIMRFDCTKCPLVNRRIGKTLAYCIKLALSDGDPLDIDYPEKFCDYPFTKYYAKNSFLGQFLEIREKLRDGGLQVRKLVLNFNIID